MERNVSNHSHRDEKLRLSRNGNYEAGLRRTEERLWCRCHIENIESKSKVSKKYTTSSRNRSPSPRHRSSRHVRYEDSKYDNRDSYRSDRERNHSRGRSREYKETVRRHSQLNTAEEEHLRERKSHRDHSRSREREQRAWVRDSHHRSSKDERSYRERSRERSRERRERDRSREHRIPPSHYIE